MNLLLLTLAVSAVVVHAQTPCHAPYELTFRATQWAYGEADYARFFVEYDYTNQRVVMFEEDEAGGTRHVRMLLFLYGERTGYEMDLQSRQCKKFPLEREMRVLGVPLNATYDGQVAVGGPPESLFVDRWNDRTPHASETWSGDFSLKHCYPLNMFIKEQGNYTLAVVSNYYDIVTGIVNPNDFSVPHECLQSATTTQMIPLRLRRARSLLSFSMHE